MTFPDRSDRQPAGPYGLAIQMHGACTALRYAATELRSRESEYVAKNPKQRHIPGHVDVTRFAIDTQSDHVDTSLDAVCTAGTLPM